MAKRYWIKERHNPQLGVYYVAMGQMSAAAAKRCEDTLYGDNYMHPFDSGQEYQTELARLIGEGNRVNNEAGVVTPTSNLTGD
jgi:hypothetical protein